MSLSITSLSIDFVFDTFGLNNNPWICQALIDGEIVVYDGTSDDRNCSFYQDETKWLYLGKGVIFAVNGWEFEKTKTRHFWKRIE